MAKTFVFFVIFMVTGPVAAQTDTIFTYQGELKQSGEPANGTFNMDFSLWANLVAGGQIESTIMLNNVDVNEGIFSVELDFGANAFNNAGRWLGIAVNGTTLNPRQPITRSPYSIQTRGIFVAANYNVGIGTTSPSDELHVRGDNATFKLEDDDDPNSFTLFQDTGPSQLVISKVNASGISQIDITPNPTNGTDNAVVRIFRGTNTTGLKSVNFLRGNNTTQLSASIGVDGKDSFFQLNGGNLGIDTLAPDVKLQIEGGTDASPAGGGYLQVGPTSAANVVIDENEIMARNNGGISNLHINNNGGEVILGGPLDFGLEVVIFTADDNFVRVDCPSGKTILSGGCSSGGVAVLGTSPVYGIKGDAWRCQFNAADTGNRAFAFCANVKLIIP